MSLAEIIQTGLGCAAIIMTLVEITPVKINPWSTIAKGIGRVFNQAVLQRIDQMEQRLGGMEKDIKTIQEESAAERAISCRARILLFGDEVLHGQRHTKDPKRAKPWLAPNGTSGLYELDECATENGHVYQNTHDNNEFSPSALPERWTDLGTIEEVQGA